MVVRQTEDVPVPYILSEFAPDLRELYEPLIEPLALAGQARTEHRSTAAELLEGLANAVHILPAPAPLPLEDITYTEIRLDDGNKPVNGEVPADGVLIHTNHGLAGSQVAVDDGRGPAYADEAIIDSEAPTLLPEDPSDGHPVRVRERARQREARKRRGWWKWLLGLIVFAAMCAGALYTGIYIRQAQPELTTVELGLPTFPVHDYRGMTEGEVQLAASEFAWTVDVSSRHVDGTEPGQILSQSPSPGFKIPAGGTVAIEVSLGPILHAVPELVGRRSTMPPKRLKQWILLWGRWSRSSTKTSSPTW